MSLSHSKVDQAFHLDTSAFINPAVYRIIDTECLTIFFIHKTQNKIVLSLLILKILHFYPVHCTQGFTS